MEELVHGFRFVTNHAHVLQCIATDPTARMRDIAATVGITERATAAIVSDLEQFGYLTRTRDGRRNRYEVHAELPLRHPQHRHRTVGDLIRFLTQPEDQINPQRGRPDGSGSLPHPRSRRTPRKSASRRTNS